MNVAIDLKSLPSKKQAYFRTYKSRFMGKGMPEEKAIQAAMGKLATHLEKQRETDSIESENVVSIGFRPPETEWEEKSQVFTWLLKLLICSIIVISAATYQVYTNHSIFGPGVEGYLVSGFIEILIISLGVFPAKGLNLYFIRFFWLCLIAVCLVSLHVSSVSENQSLNRLESERLEAIESRSNLPVSHVTKREQISKRVAVIDSKIEQLKKSVPLLSTSGVSSLIRYINLFSQIIFTHAIMFLLCNAPINPWYLFSYFSGLFRIKKTS